MKLSSHLIKLHPSLFAILVKLMIFNIINFFIKLSLKLTLPHHHSGSGETPILSASREPGSQARFASGEPGPGTRSGNQVDFASGEPGQDKNS